MPILLDSDLIGQSGNNLTYEEKANELLCAYGSELLAPFSAEFSFLFKFQSMQNLWIGNMTIL